MYNTIHKEEVSLVSRGHILFVLFWFCKLLYVTYINNWAVVLSYVPSINLLIQNR